MSLDNKTLEARLLTKDSVIGASTSITKCAAKLQQFGKNPTNLSALEAFMREMLLMKLEGNALIGAFEVYSNQEKEYEEVESSITAKTSEKLQHIAQLEEELRQQQLIREHRVACESAAVKVNTYASRSALKRKIDSLNAQMDSTTNTLQSVEADILQRKSQFDALLTSIEAMQRPLQAEVAPASRDTDGMEEEVDEEEQERMRDREDRGSAKDQDEAAGPTDNNAEDAAAGDEEEEEEEDEEEDEEDEEDDDDANGDEDAVDA